MTAPLWIVAETEFRRLARLPASIPFVVAMLSLPALIIVITPMLFPPETTDRHAEGVSLDDPALLERQTAEKLKRPLVPMNLPDTLLAMVSEEDRIQPSSGELVKEGPVAGDAPVLVVRIEGDKVVAYNRQDLARTSAALDRLRPIILRASDQRTKRRLMAAGLSEREARAVELTSVDQVSEAHRVGRTTGAYLPVLVVMMLLTCALAVAVSLVLAERERGTAETILSSGVDRRVLLLGKALVVWGITVTLTLMELLVLPLLYLLPAGLSNSMAQGIDGGALALLALLSIPLSLQVAALAIAAAAWAPNYRALSIISLPLTLGTCGLASLSMVQPLSLNPMTAIVPFCNLALVSREALSGSTTPGLIALAALSSLGWTAACLWIAARMLSREDALLGGVTQPRESWIRRVLGVWGLAMGMLWFVGSSLQAQEFALGMTVSQVLMIAGTGLLALLYWNQPIAETCSLRRPRARHLLLAAGVGLCLPGLGLLVNVAQSPFIPVSSAWVEELNKLLMGERPFALTLLLVAVLPALCEEVLFRGVLMGMLRGVLTDRARVVLVAVLFGLLHVSLARILPTAALGLVLGLLVVWSGSLWPAVLAHGLNNAFALTLAHLEIQAEEHLLPMILVGNSLLLLLLYLQRRFRPPDPA